VGPGARGRIRQLNGARVASIPTDLTSPSNRRPSNRREAGDHIKIGRSGNPAGRLYALQTSHFERPTLLKIIPGGRLEEERWHSRFASLCLGGEWFLSSPGLRAAIDEAVDCPEESNARTATVNVRLEPKLKEEAEHILKTLD
jgi:hypothetical protein